MRLQTILPDIESSAYFLFARSESLPHWTLEALGIASPPGLIVASSFLHQGRHCRLVYLLSRAVPPRDDVSLVAVEFHIEPFTIWSKPLKTQRIRFNVKLQALIRHAVEHALFRFPVHFPFDVARSCKIRRLLCKKTLMQANSLWLVTGVFFKLPDSFPFNVLLDLGSLPALQM